MGMGIDVSSLLVVCKICLGLKIGVLFLPCFVFFTFLMNDYSLFFNKKNEKIDAK